MRGRWLFFVIAATAPLLPLRADAAVVSICNSGNAPLNVARVIYNKSFLFGDSYQANGWYEIAPRKCEVVYSDDDPDPVYFGFTFRDSANTLRTYISEPSAPDDLNKSVSETFCVAIGQVFDYTTKAKGTPGGCQAGFQPLEFSLYMALDSGNYGRVSYSLSPDRNDRGTALGTPAGATAQLIFGAEVQFDGRQWTYADGTALPDSLISAKTRRPPLLPRQQYSTNQAPVAGYIKQIKDVMSSFRSCTVDAILFKATTSSSRFDMDDYGIMFAYETSTLLIANPRVMTQGYGAAIANLNLANPRFNDNGGGCVEVNLDCKDGVQCAREASNATSVWSLTVDTREQANVVLDALRAIARFYPDGEGELHQIK